MPDCAHCGGAAVLRRPKGGDLVGLGGGPDAAPAAVVRIPTSPPLLQHCKPCFYAALEAEVHDTIVRHALFARGDRVAVAASGGKDSTVLASMLATLNQRHDYGLDLFLLSIDEGIAGYRDDSLATVHRNSSQYGMPLTVLSYADLYKGWTVDAVAKATGTGSNCTFCGVLRRQALDRGAALTRADVIATGHNADDVAETVLLNLVRGDAARLARCGCATTGQRAADRAERRGHGDAPTPPSTTATVPRVKPFLVTYEKEIVLYAHHKRLDYFSTECVYAPFAARGAPRDLVKDLEALDPAAVAALVRTAEGLVAAGTVPATAAGACATCGAMASGDVCKACELVAGLELMGGGAGVRLGGRRRGVPLAFEE